MLENPFKGIMLVLFQAWQAAVVERRAVSSVEPDVGDAQFWPHVQTLEVPSPPQQRPMSIYAAARQRPNNGQETGRWENALWFSASVFHVVLKSDSWF